MSRRHTVHISVDVNSGVFPSLDRAFSRHYFLREFSKYALYGFAIVVLASSIFIINQGFASTTLLYPEVCLGGWVNSNYASGIPESLSSTIINERESALLPRGTASPLFCGRFSGPLPEETVPTSLTLLLYGGIVTEYSQSNTASIPPAADSTIEHTEAEDTPDGEDHIEIPVTSDEVGENSQEEVASPEALPLNDSFEQDVLPVPEQGETIVRSWHFASPRLALDDASPAPVAPAETVVPPPSETVSEETPHFQDEIIEHATSDSAEVVTSTEVIASQEELLTAPLSDFEERQELVQESETSIEQSISEEMVPVIADTADEPFIDVFIRLQGGEPVFVGALNERMLTSGVMSLPVPYSDVMSWGVFAETEVSLVRRVTVDEHPAVLIDGMALEVGYEPVSEEVQLLEASLTETTFSFNDVSILNIKATESLVALMVKNPVGEYTLVAVLPDEQKILSLAPDDFVEESTIFGLHRGALFWYTSSRGAYSFIPETKQYRIGRREHTTNNEEIQFSFSGTESHVIIRGETISFVHPQTGELLSDDDGIARELFLRTYLGSAVFEREDLIELGVVPPPVESVEEATP